MMTFRPLFIKIIFVIIIINNTIKDIIILNIIKTCIIIIIILITCIITVIIITWGIWNEVSHNFPKSSPYGKMRNEEIRQSDIPSTTCKEITKHRLKWFGHVVRMPHHRLPYHNDADACIPRGRPRGCPPTRWKDQVQCGVGLPTQEAKQQAPGRSEWSRISVGEQRDTSCYASKSVIIT